jgi:hypothetical protein
MPTNQKSRFVHISVVDATHNHAVSASPSNSICKVLDSVTEPESEPMVARIVVVLESSDDEPLIENQLGLDDYPDCSDSTSEETGEYYFDGRQQ